MAFWRDRKLIASSSWGIFQFELHLWFCGIKVVSLPLVYSPLFLQLWTSGYWVLVFCYSLFLNLIEYSNLMFFSGHGTWSGISKENVSSLCKSQGISCQRYRYTRTLPLHNAIMHMNMLTHAQVRTNTLKGRTFKQKGNLLTWFIDIPLFHTIPCVYQLVFSNFN